MEFFRSNANDSCFFANDNWDGCGLSINDSELVGDAVVFLRRKTLLNRENIDLRRISELAAASESLQSSNLSMLMETPPPPYSFFGDFLPHFT